MSFQSLGLSDALLQAISKKGYTTPTPIQAKSIPLILDRKDVLASAQTGTGKTAGFALPIIQLLSEQSFEQRRPIRCLILTPTRELAAQVHAEIKEYSAGSGLTSTVIFGGVNQNPQVAALKRGVDILIATPGRLMDLHNQKELSLRAVEILVLDEADRMLDMGFLRDIRTIMNLMPAKRQNLLFSATFSKEIRTLADSILNNPISVEATPENSTAEKVEQKVLMVDKGDKITVLTKLIIDGNWEQVLVFTRTKHGANKLTEKLVKQNITAAAIHGNKTQNARTKALDSFKKGTIRILVATDIAARGLDIPLLPHVVNFELPNVPEDYVHRIGRTGRAGASGEALSLVAADEVEFMRAIEKLLGQKFDAEEMVGFEPTEIYNSNTPKANPNNKRHQGNRPKPSFNKNKSSFKSRR